MQEVTNAFDASRKINLEKMETILEKLAENLKDRESIIYLSLHSVRNLFTARLTCLSLCLLPESSAFAL